MKQLFLTGFCIIIFVCAQAQSVAINNDGSLPNTAAILDIKSANKGILIPRVSLTNENDNTTIPSPAVSLLVFNTNLSLPNGRGFYFWDGSKWNKLSEGGNAPNNFSWNIGGNNANSANFIGTTNNIPLIFKSNNVLSGIIDPNAYNSFFGYSAGSQNITGLQNVFLGAYAGNENLTGSKNVLIGYEAGREGTIGDSNVFVGHGAGRNKKGEKNVAVGFNALSAGYESANYNIAIGYEAGKNAGNTYTLRSGGGVYIGTAAGYNATGGIAIGDSSCKNCQTPEAFVNIAIGHLSLLNTTSGIKNTALGINTLLKNTTGGENTAIGFDALQKNTIGINNVAVGNDNSIENTTGFNNTSVGARTLLNNNSGENNTALGFEALSVNTIGDRNTAIGVSAGPLNNNFLNTTCIGYNARASTGNTMVFGNNVVTRWAFGLTTTGTGKALEVGSDATNGNGAYLTTGGTWTNTSSRLKKEDFSAVKGLELLQKVKELPVQRWKYKGTNEYHIGPVAEDFYKAFGLGMDDKGISTVDPSGIALAAIQEQQRIIEKQNDLILQLQKRIEALEKIVLNNKN